MEDNFVYLFLQEIAGEGRERSNNEKRAEVEKISREKKVLTREEKIVMKEKMVEMKKAMAENCNEGNTATEKASNWLRLTGKNRNNGEEWQI